MPDNRLSMEKVKKSTLIITSPQAHFSDLIQEGLKKRNVSTYPLVSQYLTQMLCSFVESEKMIFTIDESEGQLLPQTFAECWLMAQNLEPLKKKNLLKKLAEKSLFFCGFFSDSFKRSLVDVDYYCGMGRNAYSSLSTIEETSTLAKVYSELSYKFIDFVDVLTTVSMHTQPLENKNVLRVYEKYLRTGSKLALETLTEQGIVPNSNLKSTKQ